ncbi:uncharacterized protein [Chelonus insularis]|uniref:uncharacterized protein n=1 Tax=Chelonus insularis TaxID=460826 RepID=UPI00158AF9A9|nr:uncharacterized protein LOC118070405 [Chelonus insularis]
MGKNKKSRSRDRSEERTSKRLRKLEDKMEELTSGFAQIKDVMLRRSRSYSVSEEADVEGTGSGDDKSVEEVDASVEPSKAAEPPSNLQSQIPQVTIDEQQNIREGVSQPGESSAPEQESIKDKENESPWDLDADALRILGEEPVEEKPMLVLHSNVANRWKKYLSEGLRKEVKESLFEKYPRKGKLPFEPPILNEEVAGNLKESVLKRDKYFCTTQMLAGSALVALAPVIESLATLKDSDSIKRLEQVWDAAKLLIEIHKSQTVARRACILPTLSKQWATALEKREPDNFLFGEKLTEKVKEIKAMEKVGEEMKPTPPKKPYGYKIPFESTPIQTCPLPEKVWSDQELTNIQSEISELLMKGAMKEVEEVPGQFLSPFFLVPKTDGQQRFILNLKDLNKFINVEHFELEDLRSACNLLDRDIFMGTIDLKDVYFLIPVWKLHRKFLRFVVQGKLYEFVCLPFGLCTCPLTFTKVLKPVLNYLRLEGFLSVIYLDDFLCLGHSVEECMENLHHAINLLEKLGFIVNFKKSKLNPERRCKYLGFILDSSLMRVELPEEKKLAVQKQIKDLKKKSTIKIREFAKVIGSVVACCPAVEYGLLHCRSFEKAKIRALEKNRGYFDAVMTIPKSALTEWDWWLKTLPNASRKVRNNHYERTVYSDASLSGWGAFCEGESANGLWSLEERNLHINYLELKAALLALKCFAADLRGTDILMMVDNTTTMAYINKMGGVRYSGLHRLACELWNWCEVRKLWVYASYIPSEENVEADRSSRIDNSDAEWELADYAFEKIVKRFGKLEIDLFASRINTKCETYCSWKRDPVAYAFDAFTISWSDWIFYAFPPFAVTASSSGCKTYPGCREVISQALLSKGMPREAVETSLASLADSTSKNYNSTLKLWWKWNEGNGNPYEVSVEKILKFLAERFSDGIGHSAINSGASKIRPGRPKYESTWDVDPVLARLETWAPITELSLKKLTEKSLVLLALGTAHRCQTLALIKISNINIEESEIEIRISDKIKTSRPGAPQPVLRLPFFLNKPELCIARTLNQYISVTKDLREGTDSLFIALNKPHKAVKSETIARWIRTALESLGDDKRFTAHSTRHASTSRAQKRSVSIDEIKKVAGWSRNSEVFADFYHQRIVVLITDSPRRC